MGAERTRGKVVVVVLDDDDVLLFSALFTSTIDKFTFYDFIPFEK